MIDRDGLIVKLLPTWFREMDYKPGYCQMVIGRPVDEMTVVERDARTMARELREFATAFILEMKLADDEQSKQSNPARKTGRRAA